MGVGTLVRGVPPASDKAQHCNHNVRTDVVWEGGKAGGREGWRVGKGGEGWQWLEGWEGPKGGGRLQGGWVGGVAGLGGVGGVTLLTYTHKNLLKTHVLKKHYSSGGTRNQL